MYFRVVTPFPNECDRRDGSGRDADLRDGGAAEGERNTIYCRCPEPAH